MKTTIENKFKDRSPKETVAILKDFFTKSGYTLVEDHCNKIKISENCWEALYYLYYNDIKVLQTCGKGTNEDFCRASGCAEMYERFCTMLNITADERLVKLIQDNKYKNYGYYWNKNEKQVTLAELLNDSNLELKYKNRPTYIKFLLDSKLVAEPFKCLNDDSVKYFNRVILQDLLGSNGMAAGNTLEEALVQGISEVFEREATCYLLENPQAQYYSIPTNVIKDPVLVDLIKDIEATNNKIIILDLSYNINLPAVAVFFIDINNMKITATFGSHPIFEIAVERCLTEQYQGYRNEINDLSWELNFRRNLPLDGIISAFFDRPETSNLFPDSCFINSQIKDLPSQYFLSNQTYSNIELLDFYKQFCKDNNIVMYYKDYSLSDNFYSIQAYCEDFHIIGLDKNNRQRFANNDISIENYITYNKFYDTLNYSFSVKHNMFSYFKDGDNFRSQPWENLIKDHNLNDIAEFYQRIYNSIYKINLLDYLAMYRYKYLNYDINLIKQLYNYLGKDFSYEVWENCDNINYLIKNVIYPAFKERYSEETLINILRPYIESEE